MAAAALVATTLDIAAQATVTKSLPQDSSPADDEVISLSPFSVNASDDVGYGSTTTGSSSRLKQAYIDTPQVTSVVTSELMKDAGLYDSSTAITFVPNVSTWRTSDLQSFNIRGIGTNTLYMDGFFGHALLFIDTAFTDRVEVVKGPSTTAFGRGDPAGFINYVSKRPQFREGTRASAMAGTGGPRDTFRFTVDRNGLLGDKGTTAYRFVGLYTRGSGTRDGSEFDRKGALLSVDHRFKDRGELQFTSNYFVNNSAGTVGNLSFSDATLQRAFRSTIVGGPVVPFLGVDDTFNYDGTGFKSDYVGATVVLNYKLGEKWNTRQAFNYAESTLYGIGSAGNVASVRSGPNGLLVTLPANLNDKYNRGWSYQADFLYETTGKFLNSKYSLLFGGDASDGASFSSAQAATGVGTQLLLAFNPHVPLNFPSPTRSIDSQTSGLTWSPYVQVQDSLFDGRLQITAAVRYIYFDQEGLTLATGAVSPIKYRSPLLPTYSILYKPVRWLSVYALKSKYQNRPSFRPQYTGVGGAQIPPGDPRLGLTITTQPTTELTEFGIKGSIFKEKINFSLAYFEVDNTGVGRFATLPDPVLGSVIYNFASQDVVKGWEIEIFGQPTRNITLMLGAGFLDSHANVPVAGGQIFDLAYPNNPNTVHGNIKYSFGPKAREGFSMVAGAKSILSGWSANVNSVGSLGNLPYPKTVTLANFGLEYGFRGGRDSISLRVSNAFHRHAVVAGSYVGAAQGRQVFLSYDKQF